MKIEFNSLRPCMVKTTEEKGLLHGFFQESHVVEPSILRGGHSGGTVQTVVAVVEFEDGHVARVNPNNIVFLDNKFKEYCFGEVEADG